MKIYLLAGVIILGISTMLGWNFLFPPPEIRVGAGAAGVANFPKKTTEERIAEALGKSNSIKGLYMTADVANDQGAAGTRLRQNLIRLAETTEINGLVIDVKEVCGPDYNEENLKKLLGELKEKNIWAVARIVAFKDASQTEAHPGWYLKRANEKSVGNECWNKKHLRAKPANVEVEPLSAEVRPLWRDKRGGYWLDPASPEAQKYILEFSRKVIDLGFDELQFDYLRFPSDGDVQNVIYPAYDGKTSKCAVMRDLFRYLNKNLKEHKPEVILSADLFGYASIGADTGIGQCLKNIEDNFDYVSFMVYPSHYYNGLRLFAIPELGWPEIDWTVEEVRTNPGMVVERSLRFAKEFFAGTIDEHGLHYSRKATSVVATSTPTSAASGVGAPTSTSVGAIAIRSRVRLRPWLEDFYHEEDKAAGRPWGAEKMRLQIEAAERVAPYGWMLWNAANIYTEEALKKE